MGRTSGVADRIIRKGANPPIGIGKKVDGREQAKRTRIGWRRTCNGMQTSKKMGKTVNVRTEQEKVERDGICRTSDGWGRTRYGWRITCTVW
jgi:hypothetical protein